MSGGPPHDNRTPAEILDDTLYEWLAAHPVHGSSRTLRAIRIWRRVMSSTSVLRSNIFTVLTFMAGFAGILYAAEPTNAVLPGMSAIQVIGVLLVIVGAMYSVGNILIRHYLLDIITIIRRVPPEKWFTDVGESIKRIPSQDWFDKMERSTEAGQESRVQMERRMSRVEGFLKLQIPGDDG